MVIGDDDGDTEADHRRQEARRPRLRSR